MKPADEFANAGDTVTVDSFIAMTQRIVGRDGFDGYLPTLILPTTKTILVLEGIPDGVNTEDAAREWLNRKAGTADDYFLAFKVDQERLKIVARVNGLIDERSVPVSP